MTYPVSLLEASRVMPRFWIGTPNSCDVVRNNLSFFCIYVANQSHTSDQRCHCTPILGADGLVDYKAMAAIEGMIYANWTSGVEYLIHCTDGNGLSPLVLALWIQDQHHLTLSDAYKWLMNQKTGIQNLTKLVTPQATLR